MGNTFNNVITDVEGKETRCHLILNDKHDRFIVRSHKYALLFEREKHRVILYYFFVDKYQLNILDKYI